MVKPDGKRAALLLIGKGEGAPAPSGGSDLEAAMSDFLAGLEAKDPAAMAQAFKAAHSLCGQSAEGEGE